MPALAVICVCPTGSKCCSGHGVGDAGQPEGGGDMELTCCLGAGDLDESSGQIG
jgi:hypothetical protein